MPLKRGGGTACEGEEFGADENKKIHQKIRNPFRGKAQRKKRGSAEIATRRPSNPGM